MARQHPIEVFMPPNILKAKAGGRYRGLDTSAIRRAEIAMETLKSEFRDWTREDLKNLVAARDRYARSGTIAARTDLLRLAHDLRGQAASFDFTLIARIAGSLSTLLEEVQAGKPLPPGLVDAHVDAMQVIFRENIADERNEIARLLCTELYARVTDALSKKGAGRTAR